MSHAVAIVTWLCGKHLAEQRGFFTRQLLQMNVHLCMKDKIEQGVVTKTKVNRCMQIVLNSCFHYVIPRVDGVLESGSNFAKTFASEVKKEGNLFDDLALPWKNLDKYLSSVSADLETILSLQVSATVSNYERLKPFWNKRFAFSTN